MFEKNDLKLLYVWVEDYKNIKEKDFNFSNKYKFNTIRNNNEYIITCTENKIYNEKSKVLFEENINITAVIGKNGSGKSSLLEIIYSTFRGFARTILVFEDKEKKIKIYSTQTDRIYRTNFLSEFTSINIGPVAYFSGIKNNSGSIGHWYYHKDYDRELPNIAEQSSNGFYYSEKKEENEMSGVLALLLNEHKDFFDFLDEYEKFKFNRFRFEVDPLKFRDSEINWIFDPAYQNEKTNIISSFKTNNDYFIKMNNIIKTLLSPEINTDIKVLIIYYSFIENINEIFQVLVNHNGEKKLAKKSVEKIFQQYFKALEPSATTIESLNWQTFQEKTISFFNAEQKNLNEKYRQVSSEINNCIYELNKYNNPLLLSIIYVLNELHFINHQGFKSEFPGKDLFNQDQIDIINFCIAEVDFSIEKFNGTKLTDYQSLNFLIEIIPKHLQKKIYLNFYNDKNRAYSYRNLSQGEKTLLAFFTDLYLYFNGFVTGSKKPILLFDEIDVAFHPEWQRSYIYYLTKFFEKIDPERKNIFNVLLTTHSPFVISDLQPENILLLENDESGYCKQKDFSKERTFGSNIHTLLSHSFFMNNTMGKFAENKIQEVINYINSKSEKISKLPTTIQNDEEAKNIIDLIGEDIIRNLLLKQLDREINAKNR